jgi:hypothetical protein
MANKLIVCGDSFSIGIGCRDLHNEPYGSKLSKTLDRKLINLAKGSSTNFSIYLQAKYAVDKLANSDDIVLVSNTSYDRVDWFSLDYNPNGNELSNTDVNYHQYPPYGPNTYLVDGQMVQLEHPMSDDLDYRGTMFTENYAGIIDYWENFCIKNRSSGYYTRFDNEPSQRTQTLYNFASTIHEPRINRLYSIAILGMAHVLLKRAGIKHLVLTHELDFYAHTMDRENLVNVDWGQLSLDYPDDLKTWHTSLHGHEVAHNIVLEKLKENGWI